jgi:hypothetical protein
MVILDVAEVAALFNVNPLPVIDMQQSKQAPYQPPVVTRLDTRSKLLWLI